MLVATFFVHHALCGLDAMLIREVIRMKPVTSIHQAPSEIVGILNLRGKIVTVFDLGDKLALGKLTVHEESHIVLVEAFGELLGLLIDSTGDVVEIDPERIEPPPSNVSGIQGQFFQGVCYLENQLIALLNLKRILFSDEQLSKMTRERL